MKNLTLLFISLLLFNCITQEEDHYLVVPVQSRDQGPCEFEVWEIHSNNTSTLLGRIDNCTYTY